MPPRPNATQLLPNVIFSGPDVAIVHAESARVCHHECLKRPHCLAFTFTMVTRREKACWLKGLGYSRHTETSVGTTSGIVRADVGQDPQAELPPRPDRWLHVNASIASRTNLATSKDGRLLQFRCAALQTPADCVAHRYRHTPCAFAFGKCRLETFWTPKRVLAAHLAAKEADEAQTRPPFYTIRAAGASFLISSAARAILAHLQKRPGERFVQDVFARVLNQSAAMAASRRRSRPLVLDVGANAGFYGLLAVALGADVLLVEPQPSCWGWIESSIRANGAPCPRQAATFPPTL